MGRMKTVLVTGSNDGIGKATALKLAVHGCAVIVHGRNEARATRAADEIRATAKSDDVTWVAGDFAALEQVRGIAERLRGSHPPLDVLVNNAGIVAERRELTRDGFESTFAINHLAPFLLTNLLLDHLSTDAPARIVNVSSSAHKNGRIDFEDLQMEQSFDRSAAYANSKLANALFTRELARRLPREEVIANFLHPGVISTKLLHALGPGGAPVADGAATPVFVALDPSVADLSGRYGWTLTE